MPSPMADFMSRDREGAVLAVSGDMDADGYYSAEFNGRRGRLPANFVQEVEVTDPTTKTRLFDQTLGSPLPLDSYPVPSRFTLLTSPTETSLSHSYLSTQLRTPSQGSELPQPPTSFRVEKALGNSVLLVTWQPPKMDSPGGSHSNGCLVTGYQLYVDGETKTLVSGASQTKTTLVGLNLSQSLTLGVSTAAANGKSSKVISMHYHPAPVNVTGSTTTPEPEQYRMFIALYDYDPLKSSPCEHPEFELPFSEGDLIKIYGREMDDGFMSGELNGQNGLVPASFVSEAKSSSNKRVSDWREASLSESVRTTRTTLQAGPKLPHTTMTMVGAFDYDPEKDSPNPNPGLELAFKRGDQITVYGKMHGDGYYSGQLAGKFGLVPSNFLTKPKPTSPDQSPTKSPEEKLSPKVTVPNSTSREHKAQGPSGADSGAKTTKSKPSKSKSVDPPVSTRTVVKATDSPAGTKKKRQGFRWPGSRN